jgi:hypothetical protein
VKIDTTAPTTTVANLPPGWSNAAVTASLIGIDSASGVAVTEYSLDGGSTWVAGNPPVFGAEGEHSFLYRSRDVAGNTESAKTARVKIDTTAPTTTIANVPAGWSKGAVIATFSAADALSGVAATEYSLDGGASWKAGSSTMVIKQGTCTLLYRSRDAAGNTEATQSATVRIDSIRPVPRALSNVTGRRGKSVRLPYRVNDAAAPQATVTIKIFKAGRRVKLLSLGSKTTNTTLTCSYRCPLAKGTYVWKVYATDLAGNTQAVASSRKLSVR